MKQFAREGFHRFGGLHLPRLLNRTGLRILVYHRFPGEQGLIAASLAAQCAHIVRHYRPIALDSVVTAIVEGGELPTNAIAVTVDDGYRDFLPYAAPLFEKFQIPVTMFLASDFVDGKCWLWVDQIRYAFRNTACRLLNPARIGLPGGGLPLENEEQRMRAAALVKALAKELPDGDRLELLRELPRALDVESPCAPPVEDAALSWPDVHALAQRGVEFGAHTRTHPILSRVNHVETVESEIAGSKQRIEAVLRKPVRHFCYPNGRSQDYSPLVKRVTQSAGFHSAVTTMPGVNSASSDPFALKRIVVEPHYPALIFHEICAVFRLEAKGIF